ncbi:MAG: hypothetical protein CXT78_12440 [Thaumarchaeota archaeon]|nr:MAG: hypothetical protein CXT78_12440 [Nitrososphaerota archaeon]
MTEKNNLSNEPIFEKNKNLKNIFLENWYLHIIIIGVISISLKLYYVNFEIPFALDSLIYFIYAFDSSILGHLPESYSPANNGWPGFVSIFFSMFEFDNPISYMQLQKSISIIISTLTIIPVFLLCKKFFNRNLSLVGASIFAFEPRIIQNSIEGITEPLFIFLIAITLVMFLSENKKIIYGSFGIISLGTMVRGEGIMLFFVISIMFFIKYRQSWSTIPKYIPAALIFILILLPMSTYRNEVHDDDRVFGRIIDVINVHILTPAENDNNWNDLSETEQQRIKDGSYDGSTLIAVGIENYFKFFIWILIPIFILAVPIGIILIFKNLNYKKLTIIFSIIGLSIPIFYAYSLSILDTRYLYVLYPMLAVISIFAVERFLQKNNYKNIILIILVSGILITSISFLEYKKIDAEHEKEAFEIAKYVVAHTTAVNFYSPESQYIKVAEVFRDWPSIPIHTSDGHFDIKMPRVNANEYDNLNEFISNSENIVLSHLVIDIDSNMPNFLIDVFENEKKYPYLIKEYDSKEDSNLNYHVKIFKINYENFE